MNDNLLIARKTLLEPAAISDDQLLAVLARASGKEIDLADVYLQSGHYESWHLEEGIVKDGVFQVSKGAGIRAVSGEKSGFAYCNELKFPLLLETAATARQIVYGVGAEIGSIAVGVSPHKLYAGDDPLATVADSEKIELLKLIDAEARAQDDRIKQVMVSLAGNYKVILIVTSDGELVADVRPMVRLQVGVIAEEKGRYEQGGAGGGGRCDYHRYFAADCAEAKKYAHEAVRIALLNLQAKPAPAGVMSVVLGSGWPGVLLHEAVGHGLEGDFNRKGSSAFAGRMGEKVASSVCSVVDNGCLSGQLRGSLNVDDEGVPTQMTTLIENGVLCGYLQDKLNAKLMGVSSTGNGRRESYAHLPLPRMTNTYMLPGDYAPEEIISSVTKGIYAVNFSGGQVDITSGKFVFSTSEAYLIEDGKIGVPVKGATLIGDGPTVLQHVSMVGNDLRMDEGVGTCGKEGQSVPVGVGQPTLKVDELTVGGTQ